MHVSFAKGARGIPLHAVAAADLLFDSVATHREVHGTIRAAEIQGDGFDSLIVVGKLDTPAGHGRRRGSRGA